MNKAVYHKGRNGNLIENENSSMNALRDLIPENLISRFEGVVMSPNLNDWVFGCAATSLFE